MVSELQALLTFALRKSAFYQRKLHDYVAPNCIADYLDFAANIPFTTKRELLLDQQQYPPYGSSLTQQHTDYVYLHKTSGSCFTPWRRADTEQSYAIMVDTMQCILNHYGISDLDRCFFAYSFGPYLGCWVAWSAAKAFGCLCIPGGGMHTINRLQEIRDNHCTILFCTPTYVLHLLEAAKQNHFDLSELSLRMVILAGEPGGSLAYFRKQIALSWPNILIFDHYGMTELGPVAYQCPESSEALLHIVSDYYYAEIIDPKTSLAVAHGTEGELVVTPLKNYSMPLLRYRTGDLVCETQCNCSCNDSLITLKGGILGRVDDMITVRGVNIFPTTIDEIVRTFPQIKEYQVEINRQQSLAQLCLKIELDPMMDCSFDIAEGLNTKLLQALDLRTTLDIVDSGTLERFEFKAKRWNFV